MKKIKERKERFVTASEIELKSIYNASDLNPTSIDSAGEFPYTRGVHSGMYRSKLWTMRQYAGFGSATKTNERYKYLLKHGTTGLSVAFDLPTQMGHDSDHGLAKGEVGRVGVAISTVEDMETLFSGIPLDQVSVSMTINSTASILLAFLLIVAEKQGVSFDKLTGTIQNDILKEYIARGTYIYPPRHALRIVTDIFSFCGTNVPKWNTISISGYHIREAGSNAVQEVAFTLANAITYTESAIKAGLKIDDFAPRLAFFFNCHNDFLEEIAKFRAARRLWAKIVKERFGAKKPESMMLRFHTQTAGSSLTAQQPHNNIVRTTVQALAAVLGGTQSLHTNSFDEALGLPTEESARIALRTQQIIAHESGVTSVVDPLGGSYLIESMTDQIEKSAMEIIDYIDRNGGMLKAIEDHFPQNEIEKSAYKYQSAIEKNEQVIVGVNQFQVDDEKTPDAQILDPQQELDQVTRLNAYKKKRDSAAVKSSLQNLTKIAKGEGNIMQAIWKAAKSGATLGEISDCMRAEYGEYSEF